MNTIELFVKAYQWRDQETICCEGVDYRSHLRANLWPYYSNSLRLRTSLGYGNISPHFHLLYKASEIILLSRRLMNTIETSP